MALWYIDPRISAVQESDSFDGGFGVGRLRDSWADVTWLAGDYFFGHRAGLHVGAVTINASGTASAWITVRPYGEGDYKPRINANGSNLGGWYASGRGYIDIRGFEVTGATAFPAGGVHMLNCNDIVLEDLDLLGNEYGIRIDNAGSTEKANFRVSRAKIHDSEQSGVIFVCGTSVGGSMRGVTIDDCDIRRSGTLVVNNGIHITTRIGTSGAGTEYDASRVVHDLKIRRTKVVDTTSYGMMLRYATNVEVSDCEISKAGRLETADTHSLWLGGCRNAIAIGNEVHGNFARSGAASGSGVGIFIDQGSNNLSSGHDPQNVWAIGNRIYEQFRGPSTAINASAAITFYRATDCGAMGNVIHDCRNGISIRGASTMNSERLAIYNNTCVGIDEMAYAVGNLANLITLKNNIAKGAQVGFWQESGGLAATNVTREYNCSHGHSVQDWATGTLAAITSASANTGDFALDPRLDAAYRLLPDSPCRGAGQYIPGVRHMGGMPLRVPADIGAYGYVEPREVAG